jgi:CheY-like chemotaxis protein
MTLSRELFGIQEPTAMQPLLSQMHENAQAIAADVAALPPGFAGNFSEAFSALLKELSENPRRVSPSNVRTIFQAVNSLGVFLNRASISSTENEPRYRVLAVDDEPGIRKIVQLALESVQLVVDSAQDAQEALTVSKQNRYDLFVLDVNMPGLSGFELCQKLRASPPYRKTPVIFVTGSDNFESRIQSASSGANDFIGKPFLSKELAVKALIHLLPHRMGLESR